MRKGFMLTEILVVLAIMTMVAYSLSVLFRTFTCDVPRLHRVVETDRLAKNMLESIQKDIESARGLPETYEDMKAGDNLLLIQLRDNSLISYTFLEEEVVKTVHRPGAEEMEAEQVNRWSLPKVQIEWQRWRENTISYAVEFQTSVLYDLRGVKIKKMANSHVFFLPRRQRSGEVL